MTIYNFGLIIKDKIKNFLYKYIIEFIKTGLYTSI